jgi:(4S)-4-hydroxy-5-phosphonooxypentane-2,3-dione isomerase
MKTKMLVMLFVLALIYAGCGNKKTDGTAQTADTLMKAAVPDYGMMIVAKVIVKPDKVKDFTEAAKEMIEMSNKEAGCRFYQLYQDPYDNTKFVFVEQYDNQSAVDAHFAAEYFKAFGPKIVDFITEPAKIKIVSMAKEVNQ